MGVLKDSLHLAVWQHLRTCPRSQTLLLSLNAPGVGPQSIRQAWSGLRENGKTEGIKKSTGLQAVLRERADLFLSHTNERGHLIIELTSIAQGLHPDDGLPPPGPAPAPALTAQHVPVPEGVPALENVPTLLDSDAAALAATSSSGTGDLGSLLSDFSNVTEEQAADPAFAAQFAEALKAVEEHGWSELNDAVTTLQAEAKTPGIISGNAPTMGEILAWSTEGPVTKKQKVGTTYSVSGRGQGKGTTKGKNGFFMDIVWTPQLGARHEMEQQKDAQLARSLFNACEIFGGKSVTLSQLGSDFNVSSIKKDPQFKNHKLIDIIRYHQDVFEVIPDPAGTGGFAVNLQPGAEAALPDAETYFIEMKEADLMLPERIEEPRSQRDRMQALRVELIHALHRRGGSVALQELGQDQQVQKVKSSLNKGQKLIEFIRMFPGNFTVTTDNAGQMMVQVASTDVYDMSMVDHSIAKSQGSSQGKGKGRLPNQRHSQPLPSAPSHYSSNDLGYGQLGVAQQTSASALATASALSTLLQHSIAGSQAVAYGGMAAVGYGALPPQPGYMPHPGYSGFSPL